MLIFQARCGADISNLVAAVANGPAAGIATTSATWMPKDQFFIHLAARSSQSWFLWFDLLQLGRTVLITQNQHMNCSMNPLRDRTRIGSVGWIGPTQFLHPNSRNSGFPSHLMRRTSTSRCSQKAFHPHPFCLLSASCLRGCKDTTTERG